jgi:acetyl esterase/lipase
MKKILILMICLVTNQVVFSQAAQQHFRVADSLRKTGDWKGSANAYSEGLRTQGMNAGVAIHINAASSWARAQNADSAMNILSRISRSERFTNDDYNKIESSPDLAVLKNNSKWKSLLTDLKKAAASNTFKQEEIIYGRKDGMALTMTEVSPNVKPNGKAIIRVMAGNWISTYSMIERYMGASRKFLDRGYKVYMVVVGSQPRFAIPDQVEDLKRSVRYIRYHAGRLGIDPDRIGIEGSSAGGNLSLIIAMANENIPTNAPDPVDRVSSRVQAAAVLYPPVDFFNWGMPGAAMMNAGEMLKRSGVFGAFEFRVWNNTTYTYDFVTDTAERNRIGREISPIYAISPDDPPVFIIHGDADMTVPLQQSISFVEKLKQAGVPHRFVIKKGGRHMPADMAPEVDEFADWFDTHLRK